MALEFRWTCDRCELSYTFESEDENFTQTEAEIHALTCTEPHDPWLHCKKCGERLSPESRFVCDICGKVMRSTEHQHQLAVLACVAARRLAEPGTMRTHCVSCQNKKDKAQRTLKVDARD